MTRREVVTRSSRGHYREALRSDDEDDQSLNFTEEENEVWRTKQAQLNYTNRGRWWTSQASTNLKRWAITVLVGVLTAFTAIGITAGTATLTRWKFATVRRVMDREATGTVATGWSFFVYSGFNLAYVSVAAATVWVEPVAAGSGIPEVKCFLNGVNVPRIVRFRTLVCKAIGVLFSVSAALPAGKEGPMIHSGSVIAASLAQGFTSSALGSMSVLEFRTDKEKRDFITCGASAGVAAAFSAPIGGVLFALEEGASFWSTALTWRAFFCGMVTLYTLYLVRSSKEAWGPNTEMFSFGQFTSSKEGQAAFSLWELLLFVAVGGLGGLAGALFNGLNRRLTVLRARYARARLTKVLEALAVCFICSFVNYMVPLCWTRCTRKPVVQPTWTQQEAEVVDHLVRFRCPEGFYNEVASLFFTDSDSAIKQLFHFREAGVFKQDVETFSSLAIATFYVPYLALACLTYGVAVPSGLFVPSLLSGAALGRLVGHLLHRLDGQSGTFADSGTYALVGAAAGLGGMARMTISLTVILLEATGNVQNLLPLMLALLAARVVGNVFNEGLYDIHIRLKHLPYLEEHLDPGGLFFSATFLKQRTRGRGGGSGPLRLLNGGAPTSHRVGQSATAGQVMAADPVAFPLFVTVGAVLDTLRRRRHAAFPVVSNDAHRNLLGSVSRDTLCLLIAHRAYAPPGVTPATPPTHHHDAADGGDDGDDGGPTNTDLLLQASLSPLLSHAVFERTYPKFPTVADLDHVSDPDRACWLDLRPYADTAPFTVQDCASIERTYRTFRTLGLRHLFVVDTWNRLRGVITRKDLDHHTLDDKLRRASLETLDATTDDLDLYQVEAQPASMAHFNPRRNFFHNRTASSSSSPRGRGRGGKPPPRPLASFSFAGGGGGALHGAEKTTPMFQLTVDDQ